MNASIAIFLLLSMWYAALEVVLGGPLQMSLFTLTNFKAILKWYFMSWLDQKKQFFTAQNALEGPKISVCFRHSRPILHYLIRSEGKGFCLMPNCHFPTIPDLIAFYKNEADSGKTIATVYNFKCIAISHRPYRFWVTIANCR